MNPLGTDPNRMGQLGPEWHRPPYPARWIKGHGCSVKRRAEVG